MIVIQDILRIIITTNIILAFYIVFHRRRSVSTTWAWLIILLVFPVIGLILYGFFGRGISQENIFAINKQHHIGLRNVQKSITKAPKKTSPADTSYKARMVIHFFDHNGESPLSKNNHVKLYTDGQALFDDMMHDIQDAQQSVNVEFYTFYNDQIGNEILNLLIKKAKEGIAVRVLYDAWGSLGASKTWFDQLRQAGGEVLPFITSRNMITRSRINYHLHRKIVVVDGKTSWTGGFNIGDQYLSRNKKFGYWRDSHVRIVGSASLLLQERFVMDWNASIQKESQLITFNTMLFPNLDENEIHPGDVPMQIVADGPDRDIANMRNGIMRLMSLAKKRVWLQTPYLIPDDAMMATLQTIAMSGVDLRIMIPCKPDHPFIYRATQWYANELTRFGIKVYIYNKGFIHAKTIVVDDDFATVGSMNQDYRSYDLNFEDVAVFYDKNFAHEIAQSFIADMEHSTLLTPQIIAKQGRLLRTLQYFSRMLSPIL
ncbi:MULTISPECIES: cardiolipin synthase [unclassified Lactobacillus]|uniref:cardiolipin synthase n=1 Tax=unclassified Lactobacillus TaxID=2620435 RepID=UPI000EFB08E3|nr:MULTISPECIES: cardiolipin synthase [unclassified Lactobacillus]RMC41984.1 cardiolipin synthase [Lactobacillus sp. ESL0237]RMC45591.1 cardiolipin synthase [Lactobacillus sp. ESL0234]RMC46978.1 cardiolipin synthase [Lactobacillus sp. ESL0236]RMC47484.1 cardiolipin synthase [Lactobacillus sp. ESL0230]RMC52003.1 cardiolipin synthase [Lactobacillus sp. ESL0225]